MNIDAYDIVRLLNASNLNYVPPHKLSVCHRRNRQPDIDDNITGYGTYVLCTRRHIKDHYGLEMIMIIPSKNS